MTRLRMTLPLNERKIHGDATDQAILRFSESLGPVSELKQLWRKTFELAFNSKNKFMIRTFSLVEENGLGLAFSNADAASFRGDDMYVLNCKVYWIRFTNICRLLTIKGAPDVLIGRCSKVVGMDGESKPLDENTKLAIERTKNSWSSQGKRVILLARKVVAKDNFLSQPNSGDFETEVMDHAKSGLTL